MALLMLCFPLMWSCSSKKEDVKIISAKTTIKGDLGKYYEVVSKEYKFSGENEKVLMIEIKRNDYPFDFSTEKLIEFRGDYGTYEGEDSQVGIGYELFDENGPIFTQNALSYPGATPNGSGDILSLLKLKAGETGFVKINARDIDLYGNAKDIFKNVTSIQITSGYTTQVQGKDKKDTVSDDDLSDVLEAADKAVDVMKSAAEAAEKINDLN